MSEYLNEVANAIQSYNAKKQRGREVTKINTEEYRLACGGSSSDDILNFNWADKPHRLVYDLASAYERQQLEIAKLKTGIEGIEIHARSMGTTITDQKSEIAELKRSVQVQYNAAMTLDEENQIARKEINELKAMVNALRRAADLYHGGYKVSELEEANSIMVMSPGQCLKSANADAVEDAVFNSEQIELFEDSNHIGKYVCLEDLEVNIKQLREGES